MLVRTAPNRSTFGVRTDPGEVWKALEFNVESFKALKSLENVHRKLTF